jgi:sterol desaturase/sphingolipid hydroxylase (fatty acid hydroxylase superfamily)
VTWTERFKTSFDQYLDFFIEQFTAPSLSAPITMIGAAVAFCLLVEMTAPRKRDWGVLDRQGLRLDLLYVVWVDLIVWPAGLFAFLAATEAEATKVVHGLGLPDPLPFTVASLPEPFALLVTFLLVDFAGWAAHYTIHRVPVLWRFHKIHHAQTTLGFASTRRFHFAEYLAFRSFLFVPLVFLGVSVDNYVGMIWVLTFLAFLSHCNVKVPLGFLNRIVITPDNHYWHHAKNLPKPYGVNFASALCIWDHLFGTFHLPDDEPELGIHNDDVPTDFLGQQLYPLLALFRPDPGGSFAAGSSRTESPPAYEKESATERNRKKRERAQRKR